MANTRAEKTIAEDKLEALSQFGQRQHKYEVIKDFLLGEFANGNYKPGRALPSENTLIQNLGVARSTVRKAVEELVKAGVVERIQGKGSFFVNHINSRNDEQHQVFSLILPELSSTLYPALIKGFGHQASVSHQQVMLSNTDYDINKQGNIILQMIAKTVSGVAIVPALSPPTPAFQIEQLLRNNIPVVFCHRHTSEVCAPLVCWDRPAVARMGGEFLLKRGHRQIAYFAGYRYSSTETYEKALRQTMRDAGLDLPSSRVYYGNSKKDIHKEMKPYMNAMKSMLSGPHPVTGIFCNGDSVADLTYNVVRELGLRVPEDVSLVGFGDCHFREGVFLNRLTSVTVDEYALGVRAAQVLSEIQTGHRRIDSEEVIYQPLSMIQGETVAAI